HPISQADLVTVYDIEETTMMKLLRADSHAPEYLSAFEGFALCLEAFREPGPPRQVIDPITSEPMLDEDGNQMMAEGKPKLRSSIDITEEFYGYYLAPAFNSTRRIDGDMHDPFGVFTEPTKDGKLNRARRVIEMNEERKDHTQQIMADLEGSEQPWAPWAWVTDAPSGMLGLVASNLMNTTGKIGRAHV